MCLTSKWRFPRKAKKDITCFKVLRKSGCSLSGWITPYRWEFVELNSYLVANKCKTFSITKPHIKGAGYIHAYTDKKFVQRNRYSEKVFIAIIPAGTRYHISKFGHQLCAEKMFITNECPD